MALQKMHWTLTVPANISLIALYTAMLAAIFLLSPSPACSVLLPFLLVTLGRELASLPAVRKLENLPRA